MGVTEHIEGDECKFGIWTGRTPMSENKLVLKASTIDIKQNWVKKVRELIQETYFNAALGSNLPSMGSNNSQHGGSQSSGGTKGKIRFSR